MNDTSLQPWVAPALLLAAAVLLAYRFALAHAAVAGVSRARLRTLAEEGNRRAEVLAGLLGRRDAVHAALRIAFSAWVVLAAGAAWWLATVLRPVEPPPLTALAALLVVCLGAELVPRLIGSSRPERVALTQSPWVVGAYRLLGSLARWALREESAAREEPGDEDAAESFRELMDTAPLRPTQRRRITEILEFPDRTAGEVMVPRVDMVGVPEGEPLTGVAARIVESGYSRLPVYAESKDNIVGVAHARDVLAWLPREGAARDIARQPLFVTETMRLDQLLRELRAQHSSVAIVVDEYGGTAGMVTVEDVIEEIVGEIHDESDVAEATIRSRPEGGWLVPGRTGLAELAEALAVTLGDDEDVNTVGGLVLALSGDLPEPGEVVICPSEPHRLLLLVTEVDGTRIAEVAALVQQAGDEAEEESPAPPANDEGTVTVPFGTSLNSLRAHYGLEPLATGGARVEDLFAFWPPGARHGRALCWATWRLSAVDEDPDHGLRVRVEPS